MPRNEFHVRSGILSQLDLRAFSGLDLYDRGANTVTMPTFSDVGDGLYDDAMDFLNGRGSVAALTLAAQIDSLWFTATGATANALAFINSDDKLEISADLAFSISANANNAYFGVNVAGQAAGAVGARFVLVADNDWARGLIGARMGFVVGGGTFSAPDAGLVYQDLPSMCLTATGTLDILETPADGAKWFITDEGHAEWSAQVNSAISWTSTEFRDLLGFTGSEAVIGSAGAFYSISTYPISGVLIPSRPVAVQNPRVDEESGARRTMGSGYSSVHRGTFQQHRIEFYLDGPLDCKDELSHWLRECMPRLSNGRKVTFYQDWGDSRSFALERTGVYGPTTTIEDDGFRGRIDAWVVDNSGARETTFPQRLRRRIPLNLLIEETP